MLLKENNCSDEIVAAGILHDTVEDTHLTLAYIEKEFGKKIRELVENVSEPDKNLSWEKRKEFTLRKLETTSLEVRLITVADKLHNISSIYEEYLEIGEQVWKKFKRGKESQTWYYKNLVQKLCYRKDIPVNVNLFEQFKNMVEKVFG